MIPEYFADFSWTTRYCLIVMVSLIVIEVLANWLCLYFYSSVHLPTQDRPPSEELTPIAITVEDVKDKETNNHQCKDSKEKADEKPQSTGTGRQLEDIYSNKTGLIWGYCDTCDLPKPPRSHHCKVCDKCILKRDHHCYFANTCIGFYNQRYFVIFAFYFGLGCIVGLGLEGCYMAWKLSGSSYWDYFLPITVYKSFTGEFPVYYTFVVGHLYSFLPFLTMCIGFFVTQISAIHLGKTPYEISNRVRIRSLRDSAHNFRSVFGPFWGINFIFPAVVIFRQEGNGKLWDDVKKY